MSLTDTTTLDLATLPFFQWDTQTVLTGSDAVSLGFPHDTLFPPRPTVDTVFHTSVLAHHQLPASHQGLIERQSTGPDIWVFVTLLLLMSLTSIIYRLRGIKMQVLLQSLVNTRTMDRLARDNNLNNNIVTLPMGLMLVASLSLFHHHAIAPQTALLGYLLVTVGIGAFYILRNWLLALLGNIFDYPDEMESYIVSNYLYCIFESIVLLALLPLYFYLPGAQHAMFWVVGVTLLLLLFLRLSRSVKIFFSRPNNASFYLFYYLCTVEITPVIIVIALFFAH